MNNNMPANVLKYNKNIDLSYYPVISDEIAYNGITGIFPKGEGEYV